MKAKVVKAERREEIARISVPLAPRYSRLLVTAPEAAELLSISEAQLYNMLRRGEIRSVKLGRSRRISVDALREYVERLEAKAER